MRKRYNLTDLDCANCAAKMEAAIKRLDHVNDASVSFLSQKLMVDAPDDCFDAVMKEVVAICRKIEPDCTIQL